MKLSEIKQHLSGMKEVTFMLPDGSYVPLHSHVTEVGLITKHFIDCGGTVRYEKSASFQLWHADDTDHRLTPEKFLKILGLSAKVLGDEDLEIEAEYQSGTIGRYGLHSSGKSFVLTPKHTACLAQDTCGVPQQKQKIALADLTSNCCSPESGCC